MTTKIATAAKVILDTGMVTVLNKASKDMEAMATEATALFSHLALVVKELKSKNKKAKSL